MKRILDKMTIKELWGLYPVALVAPKSNWKTWYREEEAELRKVIPASVIYRIEHVGSTALSNIWAKNIVDIMLEVRSQDDLLKVRNILLGHGYRCMSQGAHRISLNKGYMTDGITTRVFHLHVRLVGDHDELYFRDYLNEHPEAARAYEKLKLELCRQFGNNKEQYIAHKTEFVQKYTAIAKQLYKNRYE